MQRCSFTLDPATVGGPDDRTDAPAEQWSCPHEAHPDAERCVFHLPADRRAELGVDPAAVTDRLVALLDAEDPGRKRVLGADLPTVHLEYQRLAGRTRHPLDLRYSDVEGLELDHTTAATPLDLRGATVGRLDLTEAEFEKRLSLADATVTGAVTGSDTRFDEEVTAAGVTFEAPVSFRGATFEDDVAFDEAVFAAEASFAGATFHGRSNERGDNAAFVDTRFEARAEFDESGFEDVDFTGATFEAAAVFESASFDGAALFDDATFGALADFDEGRFGDDASFADAEFRAVADFRGAEFEGGANVLEDDVDFEGATFHGDARFQSAVLSFADFRAATFGSTADFEGTTFAEDVTVDDAVFADLADFDECRFGEDASFRRVTFEATADFRGVEFEGGANVLEDDADFEAARFQGPARFGEAEFVYSDFHDATFEDEAVFEGATFAEDADVHGAVFEGPADFDETRFLGDGDFSDVVFEADVDFRGAAFLGEDRHLEDNARFAGATFGGRAEFDDAVFTTANFTGVTFGAAADFQRVEFRESVDLAARSAGETAYVNVTGADVAAGTVTQPADHRVRYDFTRAHLGDVTLSGEGDDDLFDSFRFVETDFDGFDFSAHRSSLERNDWKLHVFDESGADYDVAVEATPAAIETTYLYAYNNAKAMGDNDAAIEFAIHQARFRRKKNVGYVRDSSLSTGYRMGKLGDVIGNSLWYLSCGYGYRLWRILLASAFVILTWGVLYAMPFTELDNEASLDSAGALFTADGLATLWQYVYYSLITFTTVGYGDINPVNDAARFLAVTEGVLGVLLAALVVFVLGRRVSV